MPGYIHHVQWSVGNVSDAVTKLRSEYGMKIFAARTIKHGQTEVALRSGTVTFLISPAVNTVLRQSEDDSYPQLSSGRSSVDTVFNICLSVPDVNKIFSSMVSHGSRSIHQPRTMITDSDGSLEFAAVTSPCDNVIHSLINTDHYSGVFLPGFTVVNDVNHDDTDDLMTHIDHVTYVCNMGDTERILSWYRRCCGMERFLISQDEDPEVGTVFDDVGMKLNVGNWITEWMCREQGVQSSDHETEDVRNFKLVLAEPLPDNSDSHVNNFLLHHGGPGIQHIGLSTHDISSTITALNKHGASFRKPPPTYYKLGGKVEEINSIGATVSEFSKMGILIDKEETEVRVENESKKVFSLYEEDEEDDVFLLQIFSFPLFGVDTFFLEIIQRQNSRGFGGGNIRALAQSIIEFQRERDEMVNKISVNPSHQPLKKSSSNNEFESLYKYSQKWINQLKKSKTKENFSSCKVEFNKEDLNPFALTLES